MLVRLSKNTFCRIYDDKGYITNQMSRYDRMYNETGADFLSCIGRKVRDTEDIIRELSLMYGDSVSNEKLSSDFYTFINDLEKHKFIVTGENEEECNTKDVGFSYSIGDIKTVTKDFTQPTGQDGLESTYDYMIASDQRKARRYLCPRHASARYAQRQRSHQYTHCRYCFTALVLCCRSRANDDSAAAGRGDRCRKTERPEARSPRTPARPNLF